MLSACTDCFRPLPAAKFWIQVNRKMNWPHKFSTGRLKTFLVNILKYRQKDRIGSWTGFHKIFENRNYRRIR